MTASHRLPGIAGHGGGALAPRETRRADAPPTLPVHGGSQQSPTRHLEEMAA